MTPTHTDVVWYGSSKSLSAFILGASQRLSVATSMGTQNTVLTLIYILRIDPQLPYSGSPLQKNFADVDKILYSDQENHLDGNEAKSSMPLIPMTSYHSLSIPTEFRSLASRCRRRSPLPFGEESSSRRSSENGFKPMPADNRSACSFLLGNRFKLCMKRTREYSMSIALTSDPSGSWSLARRNRRAMMLQRSISYNSARSDTSKKSASISEVSFPSSSLRSPKREYLFPCLPSSTIVTPYMGVNWLRPGTGCRDMKVLILEHDIQGCDKT